MSKAKLTVIFKWHEERQKYEVQAKLPGRRMLLGYFTKEELAAHDYFQYLMDESEAA
jgi:hypothetical protein